MNSPQWEQCLFPYLLFHDGIFEYILYKGSLHKVSESAGARITDETHEIIAAQHERNIVAYKTSGNQQI